ncbi:M23 family metallopeptidase [Prescottella sp. R16]|uniref:M23 family metallopeptidase n=1 Tax=Prescottella sp. R16 TaxID=3064529 RepID=UPI00272E8297|nr:peptidoglycan DD-metalloendopeptidase family protein [Prescottella sp. R16]
MTVPHRPPPPRLLARTATAVLLAAGCTFGATAGSTAVAAPAADAAFTWPLHPRPHVTRPFDEPEHNWLPGHRGVDLAAAAGQAVYAAGSGTVVFAGAVAGRPVVSVEHASGLRTTYEPVDASVTTGSRVLRGDVLGTVVAGHPECAVDACLHWGARRGRDDYLDPLPLVRAAVIRLLPVTGGAGHARG